MKKTKKEKNTKEKIDRKLTIMVQPTLMDRFAFRCEQKDRFKTISEIIRELMVQYIELA